MEQRPRLLLKLRPQVSLAAARRRGNLRPLFEADGRPSGLGLSETAPAWFIAEVPDGGPSGWDAAHNRAAEALGIDDSAVVFVEPDLAQSYPSQNEVNSGGSPFALKELDCRFHDQDNDARPAGPGFAWHLGDEYSQLGSARTLVQ